MDILFSFYILLKHSVNFWRLVLNYINSIHGARSPEPVSKEHKPEAMEVATWQVKQWSGGWIEKHAWAWKKIAKSPHSSSVVAVAKFWQKAT